MAAGTGIGLALFFCLRLARRRSLSSFSLWVMSEAPLPACIPSELAYVLPLSRTSECCIILAAACLFNVMLGFAAETFSSASLTLPKYCLTRCSSLKTGCSFASTPLILRYAAINQQSLRHNLVLNLQKSRDSTAYTTVMFSFALSSIGSFFVVALNESCNSGSSASSRPSRWPAR